MTTTEAMTQFDSGVKLYPLYGQAHVTAIERVADGLVKVELSNGNSGLHASANLTVKQSKVKAQPTAAGFRRWLRSQVA